MNEEWGTPISKEKIIGRRNRLIEYQKTNQARFTELYQIIDENILDINYMIYEIERLNSIIKEVKEYIKKASDNEYSYGDYDIHYEVKKELLEILKGSDKEW